MLSTLFCIHEHISPWLVSVAVTDLRFSCHELLQHHGIQTCNRYWNYSNNVINKIKVIKVLALYSKFLLLFLLMIQFVCCSVGFLGSKYFENQLQPTKFIYILAWKSKIKEEYTRIQQTLMQKNIQKSRYREIQISIHNHSHSHIYRQVCWFLVARQSELTCPM